MERIFQHYEGPIEVLLGSRFSAVKAVVNSLDNSVVLLWLHDENKKAWYRLFIDGIYCGIDQFAVDKSFDDTDDDIIISDYSDWFRGKKILSAKIFSDREFPSDMVVSLKFAETECQFIFRAKDHRGELKYIENGNQ